MSKVNIQTKRGAANPRIKIEATPLNNFIVDNLIRYPYRPCFK